MRRTAEFDAFGPWIDEVHTREELPRLYRDAGIDPVAHRLVLKVPRNIERRNATPDMHLYDFLLALGDRSLTVLRRRDDSYDRADLPAAQLIAIEDSISLLDGRLTLYTADGAATVVTYNANDPAPIQRLIRMLRDTYLPPRAAAAPAGPAPAGLDLGNDDIGLVTACLKVLDAEPGLRLISAQRRVVVGSVLGRGAGAFRLLRPVTLHAAVTLADDREIHLLHRRDRLTRGHAKVHSIARTTLRRSGIAGVRVRPHEHFPRVTVVTAGTDDAALDFPVATGAAADALAGLFSPAGPARPGSPGRTSRR
ncbi:hypothetical protein [Actinoplanes sp. N902-109]|uniref:hypothetical protein n=1 Tax=Actinoplanes sp. (strain N902-109) TaxID=649831 RepID=UPI0003294C04|nr:hypothetical protein [Actinoplanes sp. N902-109]AGL16879.1 hypothetical protein L083_3369 [Actinoplanes sp. N902-109]